MKRTYYPNQYITTREGFDLDISTYGGVYHRSSETLHKLDSAMFPYSHVLGVVLPNGRLSRIKYGRTRFGKLRVQELEELL